MKLFIVIIMCLLFVPATPALADLIWNYDSNDGTTFVTGQLTTDDGTGLPSVVGSVFALISIDTVFLNAVDITAPVNWFAFGGAPPFLSDNPGGNRIFVTSPNVAANQQPQIVAIDSVALNKVELSSPGAGFTAVEFAPSTRNHASFVPTSTVYTILAVPEPSVFLLAGIGAVGWTVIRTRHRQRPLANRS